MVRRKVTLLEGDPGVGKSWLLAALAGGSMPGAGAHREASGAGITPTTLRRAKGVLGVKARRPGGPGRQGGGK